MLINEDEFTAFYQKSGMNHSQSVEEIFAAVDKDNSGAICFNEFVSWWLKAKGINFLSVL